MMLNVKKSLAFSLLFAVNACLISAQELDKNKQYEIVCVGFYNIENLYDTINQADVDDDEFTPESNYAWNGPKYKKKIQRLGEVISQMGSETTPDGPAIIGLCEIENKSVLVDLVNDSQIRSRNYQIVHYDGPDRRGVDVALLYQPKYFKLISSRSITVVLPGENSRPTRDELLVTGELNGERVHFLVCHWPSRRGGEKISGPKRMAAAQTAKAIIDSISKAEPNAKVMLMGDLNDDPISPSVKKGLNTAKERRKIAAGQMYDCMTQLFDKGIGTLAYADSWNLFDQMIVTPDFVRFDYTSLRFYTAKIFNKSYLREDYGNFKGYPKRTYAGGIYNGGYSDHFPVYVFLVRELKK